MDWCLWLYNMNVHTLFRFYNLLNWILNVLMLFCGTSMFYMRKNKKKSSIYQVILLALWRAYKIMTDGINSHIFTSYFFRFYHGTISIISYDLLYYRSNGASDMNVMNETVCCLESYLSAKNIFYHLREKDRG